MGVSDPFCQRHEQWQALPLGTAANSTIGQYGCLVCSAAYMIDRLTTGHNRFTPWELNKTLVDHDGYANGNRLVWAALERVAPVRLVERLDYPGPVTAAQVAALDRHLQAGRGLIAKVNFHFLTDPAGKRDASFHYVAVTELVTVQPDYERLAVRAYDPWWGEVVNVAERYSPYGRGYDYALWAVAVYERTEQTQ